MGGPRRPQDENESTQRTIVVWIKYLNVPATKKLIRRLSDELFDDVLLATEITSFVVLMSSSACRQK